MHTEFLESFLAVVEHGSIASAARRLNLTPAAVTQRLRVLETEFGRPLVTRAGRTVVPTEAGASILEGVSALIEDVRQLKSLAAEETITGQLRVGAISTGITGLLPQMFERLGRRCPGLDIFVMPGTSIDLYKLIVEERLDAALLIEPPYALPKGFEFRQVRAEPLVLIAPGRMADRDPRTLLAEQPFIRYDRNNWGGQAVDAYLQTLGLPLKERLELDSLEAIAVFVDRGLGVSVVPDWAPPWPAGLSLAKFAMPESPARRIGLMWSRTSLRLRAIRAVIAELAG